MAEYNQEQNNDLIIQESNDFQPSGNKLEDLFDLIADALIISPLVNTTSVENNQKFIRNGQLQSGQGEGVLALFQKDIKANQEDLNSFDGDGGEVLRLIADSIVNFNTLVVSINEGGNFGVSIELSGGGLTGSEDITEFIVQDGTFSNVSQFIPLSQQQSIVNVNKANEFLDTNIFELLPTGDTRQARIIRFFQELNALLPPQLPEFDLNNDGVVDRNTETNEWTGSLQYQQDNSISYAQDNTDGNIDEEDAFIHRLKSTANDTNSTRTIEDIYNRVLPYLTDILEGQIELEDIPTYRNQSSGYLQFRNPNQGIIIRNTNQEFVEGLNPSNPTWLTSDYDGLLATSSDTGARDFIIANPGTGFTITMWVRFLDKVSSGTLFNFGNPTREDNAFGFRLETFVINKGEEVTVNGGVETFEQIVNGSDYHRDTLKLFNNTNTERFVRLQVREFGDFSLGTDLGLRDSHLGMGSIAKDKDNPPDLNKQNDGVYTGDERRILNYTNIPEDFNEWYFICATYNPVVNEDGSDFTVPNNTNPNYWLNHIDDSGNLVANSNFGNKCKVEIISRSDLLRAQGFKV